MGRTQKQAWFLSAATMLASVLGILIDGKVIPPPWDGVAVAVGVFLSSIIRPPAADPIASVETEQLLAELDRRRSRPTMPPPG